MSERTHDRRQVGVGVNPAAMKNAVKIPHAMSAGMFGRTSMPDRKVPNRWTRTCAFLAPETGARTPLLMRCLDSGRGQCAATVLF